MCRQGPALCRLPQPAPAPCLGSVVATHSMLTSHATHNIAEMHTERLYIFEAGSNGHFLHRLGHYAGSAANARHGRADHGRQYADCRLTQVRMGISSSGPRLHELLAHAVDAIQLDRELGVGVHDAGALHDGADLVAQRHQAAQYPHAHLTSITTVAVRCLWGRASVAAPRWIAEGTKVPGIHKQHTVNSHRRESAVNGIPDTVAIWCA